jgi:RNA polymerase sigma-70 factor (ECF subfamily)
MTGTAAAEEFERHRPYLMSVAYRMLGTIADAEDAVQDTYLRFARVDLGAVREPRAWLTTALGRICLDHIGAARTRRERYVGQWLPEPLTGSFGPAGASPPGPEDQVTLDESVSMAMLALLESLTPAERTALILHDVLAMPYEQVAQTVGRSESACRQLVSRARAHVQARAPRFTVDAAQQTAAVRAFAAACASGSVTALVQVLDPNVVLRSDGGGNVSGVATRPVTGADQVARLLLGVGRRHPATPWAGVVNGATGLIFVNEDGVAGVMAFTVADHRITEIDFVVNPDKLGRVRTGAPGEPGQEP